jgi:hypothetical protein
MPLWKLSWRFDDTLAKGACPPWRLQDWEFFKGIAALSLPGPLEGGRRAFVLRKGDFRKVVKQGAISRIILAKIWPWFSHDEVACIIRDKASKGL